MQNPQLLSVIDNIRSKYPTYKRGAYLFVYNALGFTGKRLQVSPTQHISAKDLLQGFKDFAQESFGCMALDVLQSWGLYQCKDVGQIVRHLVEFQVLRRNDSDDFDDFTKYQFDFKTSL